MYVTTELGDEIRKHPQFKALAYTYDENADPTGLVSPEVSVGSRRAALSRTRLWSLRRMSPNTPALGPRGKRVSD